MSYCEHATCIHIHRMGAVVATAPSLEDAFYAIKIMAKEAAEEDLAQLYRDGKHPYKAFLAQRQLLHEGEYDVTGPHPGRGY